MRVSSFVAPTQRRRDVPSVTAICATGGRSRRARASARRNRAPSSGADATARPSSVAPTRDRACRSRAESPAPRRIASTLQTRAAAAASGGCSTRNDALGAALPEHRRARQRAAPLASPSRSRRSREREVAIAHQRRDVGRRCPRSTGTSCPFADAMQYARRTASSPARGSDAPSIAARSARDAPRPSRRVRPASTGRCHRATDGSMTYASPRRRRPSNAHATRDSPVVASRRGSRHRLVGETKWTAESEAQALQIAERDRELIAASAAAAAPCAQERSSNRSTRRRGRARSRRSRSLSDATSDRAEQHCDAQQPRRDQKRNTPNYVHRYIRTRLRGARVAEAATLPRV